jgi:hypothetical protein
LWGSCLVECRWWKRRVDKVERQKKGRIEKGGRERLDLSSATMGAVVATMVGKD